MISSFIFGISTPFRAAKVIANRPKLLVLSLLPVALTLLIYIYGVRALSTHITSWIAFQISSWGLDPSGWLAFTIIVGSKILVFIVAALTFSVCATIVASPLNDFLAEASEHWTEPALMPPPKRNVLQRLKLIFIDLGKSIAAALAGLIAIALSWIPGLNLVALIVVFFLIAFQYLSYPQTRRAIGIDGGVRFLLKNPASCLGFGMIFSLLFSLPFISCLAVPLAVVGATQLFARAEGPR